MATLIFGWRGVFWGREGEGGFVVLWFFGFLVLVLVLVLVFVLVVVVVVVVWDDIKRECMSTTPQ